MNDSSSFRVFLSAVSKELASYRQKIANVLRQKGIDVHDQEHLRQGGGALLESINQHIEECDSAICLIGEQCGCLPTDEHMTVMGDGELISQFRQATGQHQISYTQWEFLLAKSQNKPVYVYLTADDFKADELIDESEMRRDLQASYRDWIKQIGVHWKPLTTKEKLAIDVLLLGFKEESIEFYKRRLIRNRDAIKDNITDRYKTFRDGESVQIHAKNEEIRLLQRQLLEANLKVERIKESYADRNLMIAELRESHPDAKLQKAINVLATDPEAGTEELRNISANHSALAVNAKLIMAKHYHDSLLYEDAMNCCEESIQMDTTSVAAYEFGAYVANFLGMMERSRELLLKQKELVGDDPTSLSLINNNLGVLEKNQNRYDEALVYFEEAFVAIKDSDENGKVNYLNIEANIAGTYGEMGRYQMSIDLYEDLIPRLEQYSNLRATSILGVSSCHYALHDFSEGDKYAKKAYSIVKSNGFEVQSPTLDIMNVWVNNYCITGKRTKAIELVVAFETDLKKSFESEDSIKIIQYLDGLTKLYEAVNAVKDAKRLYAELITELEKGKTQHHVRLADANAALGKLYRDNNELQKAKRHLLRALKIRNKNEESTSINLAITQNNLAGVYCALERNDDAEPLYLESLAIRDFNYGSQHKSVVGVCSNIAKMYLSMGHAEEAYKYCRKACDIATRIFTYHDSELIAVHHQLNEIKLAIKQRTNK